MYLEKTGFKFRIIEKKGIGKNRHYPLWQEFFQTVLDYISPGINIKPSTINTIAKINTTMALTLKISPKAGFPPKTLFSTSTSS
jgi:hypothetical protein